VHDNVCCIEGLDDISQKKVNFFTRQFIDALAPSNFAATNPEVLRERSRATARTCSRASTTCCATSRKATASCASR